MTVDHFRRARHSLRKRMGLPCIVLGSALLGLAACNGQPAPMRGGAADAGGAACMDWGQVVGGPAGTELTLMARVLREHDPLPGDAEFPLAHVDAEGRVRFANPPAPQRVDTEVGYHFASGRHASECVGGKGPVEDIAGTRAVPVLLQAVAADGRRWEVIGANRAEFATWRKGGEQGRVAPGDAQWHVYYVDAAVHIQGRCDMGSLGSTAVDVHLQPGWNRVVTSVIDAGYYDESGPYLRGTRSENEEKAPAGMAWYLMETQQGQAMD